MKCVKGKKRDIEKGVKNVGNDAAFPLTNDLIIIMQWKNPHTIQK